MAKSKYAAQVRHAKHRCLERFDIQLTDHEYWKLCQQIRSGKSKILHKQSNRISVHLIKLRDQEVNVVYDKQRGTIVTFLPNGERYDDSDCYD